MKTFRASGEDLQQYITNTFKTDSDTLRSIAESTKTAGMPEIQISPWDARHLQVLLQASGAYQVVEFGTLAGYSAVAMAMVLPKGGMIHSFELSNKHAELARENIRRAGFQDRVTVHQGEARENMLKIEDDGPFDFVFIDADKAGYVKYFEWAAKNLRSGGIIAADNTLAWGKIADTGITEADEDWKSVQSLRAYNEYAASRKDFLTTLLPTGEGLTVSVKL